MSAMKKEKFRVKQFLNYYRNWCFTSHEQFWNEYNIEKIRSRCTGITPMKLKKIR